MCSTETLRKLVCEIIEEDLPNMRESLELAFINSEDISTFATQMDKTLANVSEKVDGEL